MDDCAVRRFAAGGRRTSPSRNRGAEAALVASVSTIACCAGWSVPSGPARPSTEHGAAVDLRHIIRQGFTAWNCSDPPAGRPSTMVQAPQSPSAQPSLVPVRRARVRSQSSTVMLGGAPSALDGLPFKRNRTALMASARIVSRAAAAAIVDRPFDTPCKPRTKPQRRCDRRPRGAMPGFAHFFGSNNRHPTRPRGESEATMIQHDGLPRGRHDAT
jgi:hypothetical protein